MCRNPTEPVICSSHLSMTGYTWGQSILCIKKTIKEHVDCFNSVLRNKKSLVQFKEKKIEHEFSRLDPEKVNSYESIHTFICGLNTKQFNQLLVLLDIKSLSFTSETLSGMEIEARKFRYELYGKLRTEWKESNNPLNSDFLPILREKYKLRVEDYKKGIKLAEKDLTSIFHPDSDMLLDDLNTSSDVFSDDYDPEVDKLV